MGHKAVKTTHNINNAFGIGTANTHTVQWRFKKFYKRDESLEMSVGVGHRKLITTNQLRWSYYNYTRRTQHWPFYSHLAFEQIGRVKNLDKWVPHELTKKHHWFEVFFSYSTWQQQTINWSDCDIWWKVDFLRLLVMTSSVVGLRRSSKALPKAKLAAKKSWPLFGDVLSIWSTTAFWIPVKPLHLRSMLKKSMRCTKNCNACSQYWSTERARFFFTAMPNCTSHSQRSKRWTRCTTKLCVICRTHLTSCQPTTISSSTSTSFCRENASTTSKKMLLQPQPENASPLFGKIILGVGTERCLEDGCSPFMGPGLQLQHLQPLATPAHFRLAPQSKLTLATPVTACPKFSGFMHPQPPQFHSPPQFVSQVWSRGSSLSATNSLFSPKWWGFPPIPGLGS